MKMSRFVICGFVCGKGISDLKKLEVYSSCCELRITTSVCVGDDSSVWLITRGSLVSQTDNITCSGPFLSNVFRVL